MNPSEKVTLIIGILIGLVGLCATIMYPWPADWISDMLGVSPLGGQVIAAISAIVVVGIAVLLILLKSRIKRRDTAAPRIAMCPETIYGWLLETLSAFEQNLAPLATNLRDERELTRKNRREHQQAVFELLVAGFLDCEARWLKHSGSAPGWRPHVAKRREFDRALKDIHKVLSRRVIPPKYSIVLAAYEAKKLLDRVGEALDGLKTDKHNLVSDK